MKTATVRGTSKMITAMAPLADRTAWLLTLKDIRKLPEKRTRGAWT